MSKNKTRPTDINVIKFLEYKKHPLPIVRFWKAHRWIYRKSGGKIGEGQGKLKNLMFTTAGRKSGKPRDIVITYFEIEGKLLIIGSNLGSPRHPLWYLNLKANPEVTVQIGTEVKSMIAREAVGEEREHLWNEVVSIEKAYASYGKIIERQIPVIIFEDIG